MALKLGYSAADFAAYRALCVSSHVRRITVQLTDLNHGILSSISDKNNGLIDGQIDIDADAEVKRKLSCSIYDPRSLLGMDNMNYNNGALFADRMLRVIYSIAPPNESHWYDVPVFWGPVSKVNRKGPYLSLEGSGKEFLLYASAWWKATYRKNSYRTNVLKDLMLDGGEASNRIVIPSSKGKLTSDLIVGEADPRWPVVQQQSRAIGLYPFYDGRGVMQDRRLSSGSQYTFRKLCSQPEVNYGGDNFINSVLVIGAKPKGAKVPITRRFTAPSSHPMSPYNLGRTVSGRRVWRYYTLKIEDSGLTTVAKVNSVGKAALANGLLQNVDASFDAPVIPDLEEQDVYTLVDNSSTTAARLKKWTIPLNGAPVSSYGYNKNVTPNKTMIRRKSK